MIMMRSAPSTKMGKPPPPVPPRPSKTLVAEALAKTRKSSPDVQKTTPIRTAPPPPPPNDEINRSKSTVSVNVSVQKRVNCERSVPEDVKCSTRTVIFQSPKIAPESKKVEIKKADGLDDAGKKLGIKKIDSFREGKKAEVKKKDSFRKIERVETNGKIGETESSKRDNENDKHWDQMLNDRNHVNTLIDEMFASVLEVSANEEDNKITINTNVEANAPTVVVIDDNIENQTNTSTTEKKKVQFDDRMNHELLISELESMRLEDEKIMKRQRLPSKDIYDNGDSVDVSKIQHSDWVEVSDGQEVRLSSCQITIEDLKNEGGGKNKLKLDYERIKTMSSLHGLPPLPKSLSGFNLLDGQSKPPTPVRTTSMRGQAPSSNVGHLVYPPHPKINGAPEATLTPNAGRKTTNLDAQLAILRREMYSLRQLDLSLLSQLWSLNESIQDFRQILQEQEDRVLSPPSPSPTPSSGDEGDGDEFYMSSSSMNFRTPPPPLPIRRPSSSSNASSLG